MTEVRLIGAIRAATDVMRRAAIEVRLEVAIDRFQRLLREQSLERRYSPDWRLQPRVPRGDPDGGQSTRGPGGVGGEDPGSPPLDTATRDGQGPAQGRPGITPPSVAPVGLTDPRVISDTSPDNWELGEKYTQARPPRGGGGRIAIGNRTFEMNLEQETRLDLSYVQMNAAIARVREIQPSWKPT